MIEITSFEKTVAEFHERLLRTPEDLTGIKLSADFWSLKEIVGHLIDSASNNHQRFVRLQEERRCRFPAYDGESWVSLQRYRDADWRLLIDLWIGCNRLLLWVVGNIDPDAWANLWVVGGEEHTLDWVVRDYYRHLERHVEHYETRLAALAEG